MAFKSYREESKTDYGFHDRDTRAEDLSLGALLRIADATEAMAKNVAQLEKNRDYYKQRFEDELACAKRLVRSNAALRGVITRMKAQ